MNRLAGSFGRSSAFSAIVIKQIHSSSYLAKLVTESVPALGESITEGSIASWTKAVGDKVAVDDVIAIVETDKVTVDIKASYSGTLVKQLATDTVSNICFILYFD
jgi:biotin carboxyl carrier protein